MGKQEKAIVEAKMGVKFSFKITKKKKQCSVFSHSILLQLRFHLAWEFGIVCFSFQFSCGPCLFLKGFCVCQIVRIELGPIFLVGVELKAHTSWNIYIYICVCAVWCPLWPRPFSSAPWCGMQFIYFIVFVLHHLHFRPGQQKECGAWTDEESKQLPKQPRREGDGGLGIRELQFELENPAKHFVFMPHLRVAAALSQKDGAGYGAWLVLWGRGGGVGALRPHIKLAKTGWVTKWL